MKTYGIARFVKKPELRETTNGTKFSNFSLAWNERRKDGEGKIIDTAHFLDFEIWDRGAEVLCERYDKGDAIFIEQSTPRLHTWEDKETGQKRSKIVFRVDKFEPVPGNRKEKQNETSSS